jgi:chitinase
MTRAAVMLLVAVALASAGVSGADFTASSSSPTTLTAAADFNTVSVNFTAPATALSGSVALAATASSNRGVASVKFEYAPTGTTNWAEICTDATPAYGCSWNTTAVTDGSYTLRVTATDTAGYARSATHANRTVDNSPPQTSSSLPPTGSGTVTMTATATDDGSGIRYVAFQVNYQGTWYEVCRDTSSPYSCNGDSTMAEDGTYSVRTVTENNAGVIAYGSPQQITVDNHPPRGTEVTTGNGGATAGRLESGDWIRFTWNEPIAPASVMSGWNGSSTAIHVHVAENGASDRMDFTTTGGTRLNLVLSAVDLPLGGNFVSDATVLNATMSQSGNAITVTLGSWISGTLVDAGAGTITWRPSSGATDLTAKPSATTMVTEAGGADVDF